VRSTAPSPPIAGASRTAYEPCGDCKSVKACAVRFTMIKVREAISDVLDRMTIADMVAVSEGGNITPIVSGRSAVTGRKRR
jgi:DNA-binding IscR family transcriptional regulator